MRSLVLSTLLLGLATFVGAAGTSVTDPMDVCPLPVGAKVPQVAVQGPDGSRRSLGEVLAGKPTVLVFYRGGWCPFCTAHLAQLREVEGELREDGWQIVAVSPDDPEHLALMQGKTPVEYTLVSDSAMAAARAFGLAFEVDPATLQKYRGYGIDLEAASGGQTHHQLPVPAVFLVAEDGTIRFQYVNPDYKVRLDPEVLRAAARSRWKKAR